MRRLAACVLAACLAAGAVRAQPAERPRMTPARDVDVIYQAFAPGPAGTLRTLDQRMRWSAARAMVRVDPPVAGLHMIMDLAARRMWAVRDAQRQVLQVDAPAPLPVDPRASFARRSARVVAGLSCTDWATQDVTHADTLACITDDGVLLRAESGGRVLLQATRVSYGTQDASVFHVPDDYDKITRTSPQR